MMPADQPAAATIALYLRFNVAGYIAVLRATDPIVPQHQIFFAALGHHTSSILFEPNAPRKTVPQISPIIFGNGIQRASFRVCNAMIRDHFEE
jgi:hypothetical protein